MFEVMVIEHSPNYNGAPLATWTEVFDTWFEAHFYALRTIKNEPLSYNRDVYTILIGGSVDAIEPCDYLEVTP